MNGAWVTFSGAGTHAGIHARAARSAAPAACTSLLFCVAGCTAPLRTYHPAQDPSSLDDVAFLHYLATAPVVTVDEGMRAVLMLKGVNARQMTYAERFDVLQEVGAVNTTWHLKPEQVLDKGTLAYMLRTVCGLPRSLNELLAGFLGLGDRRYALRTCVHEGLMPYDLPHRPVKGGEMLSALTEAERYLESTVEGEP
jgi:hypothetical protein